MSPVIKPSSPALIQEAVIILGNVSVWNEEVVGFIRQKFPKLQFVFCSDKDTLRSEVEKYDITLVICQGETDGDLSESFLCIKSIYEFLDRGTSTFGIYTNRVSNPSLQVFEKRKLLRRYSPWVTPKSIPQHVEAALLDMRRAVARLRKYQNNEVISEPLPDLMSPIEPSEAIAVVDDTVEEEVKPEVRPSAPEAPRRVDSTFDDIVLISERPEDLKIILAIAKKLGCNLHHYTQVSPDIQKFLSHYPEAVIFWDVEHESLKVIPLLLKSAAPFHVFVLSDQPTTRLSLLTQLIRNLSVHHLIRRTDSAATEVYAHLVENIFNEVPLGLKGFFSSGSRRNIQLTHSTHRAPALSAMKKFLTHEGMAPRLGNLVEQACDELLLNAIYQAPINKDGIHYQQERDKSVPFSMNKAEEVTISLLSNDLYFGFCVTDSFGSIDMKKVLETLIQNEKKGSQTKSFVESDSAPHHLGLSKILDSGFSLLINVIPGQLTEAMIFFPRTKSYKEFKSGFRFFSLRSGKSNLAV